MGGWERRRWLASWLALGQVLGCQPPDDVAMGVPVPVEGLDALAWSVHRAHQTAPDAPFGVLRNSAGRLHARNPTVGGPVSFDTDGFTLPGGVRVRTRGVGMAGDVEAFAPADPVADDHAVRWRDGSVEAWVWSGPEGLTQGWTVDAPPASGDTLVIALGVEGARLTHDGTWGLDHPDGHRWTLDHLAAMDHEARPLTMHIAPTEDGMRFLVDVADAVWPVMVDPRFVLREQAYDLRTDAVGFLEGDAYGHAMLWWDDGFIASAPGTSDFAYGVLTLAAPDPVSLQSVSSVNGGPSDRLGTSLCVADGAILAGAPGWVNGTGRARFLTLQGTTFAVDEDLYGDGSLATRFGTSVACADDHVWVGAPGLGTDGVSTTGAVWPFAASGSTWQRGRPVVPPDPTMTDFGATMLPIGDDTLAVGAPGAFGGAGAVVIYEGWPASPTPVATLDGRLIGADAALGAVMTSEGDALWLGVPAHDGGRGAVFHTVVAGGATAAPTLWASGTATGDGFGGGLAVCPYLAVPTLFVGAPGEGPGHVHRRALTGEPRGTIMNPGAADARFGATFACDDDGRMAIGAPGDDAWDVDHGTTWFIEDAADDVSPVRVDHWVSSEPPSRYAAVAALHGDWSVLGWTSARGASYVRVTELFRYDGTWWERMPSGGDLDIIPLDAFDGSRLHAWDDHDRYAWDDGVWTEITTYVNIGQGYQTLGDPVVEAGRFVQAVDWSWPAPQLEYGLATYEDVPGQTDIVLDTVEIGFDGRDEYVLAMAPGDPDLLYAGVPARNGSGVTGSGGVFVFRWQGGTWVRVDTIEPPNPSENGRFGGSLAVSPSGMLVVSGGDAQLDVTGNHGLWSWQRQPDDTHTLEGRVQAASHGHLLAPRSGVDAPLPPRLRAFDTHLGVLGNHFAAFNRSPHGDGWVQVEVRAEHTLSHRRFGFDDDTVILARDDDRFEMLVLDDTDRRVVVPTFPDTRPRTLAQAGIGPVPLFPAAPVYAGTDPVIPVRQITVSAVTMPDGVDEQYEATALPTDWEAVWDASARQLTLQSMPTTPATPNTPISATEALNVLAGLRYTHTGSTVTLGARRVHVAFDGDVVAELEVDAVPQNDFPEVWAGGPEGTSLSRTIRWDEGDPAVTVAAGDAVVADGDSAVVQAFEATLIGALDAGESLEVVGVPVTPTWDGSTLVVSGEAPLALATDVLRALRYAHAGPVVTSGRRTVRIRAADGVGFGQPSVVEVDVFDANVPPVVRLSTARPSTRDVTFTEGAAPVALAAPDGLIEDGDEDAIEQLVATLSPVDDGAHETLTVSPTPGLSTSWADGVLTVTGAADVATYTEVLTSLAYANTSAAPSDALRTVSVTAMDDRESSEPVVVSVTVVPVDSTATLDLDATQPGLEASASFTEGEDPVALFPEAAITDPDGGPSPTEVVVTLAAADGADESLQLTAPGLTVVVGMNAHSLTLSGGDTASYQAALRAVHYAHAGDRPTPGMRALSVALAGSDPVAATVDVVPTDDPPALDLDSTRAGLDAALVWTEGDGATPLVPLAALSDPDDEALEGVVVDASGAPEVVLAQPATPTVVGVWSPSARTLTLGPGSAVDLQAALAEITVEVSGDDPTAGTWDLPISASSGGLSTLANAALTVVPVDDPTAIDLDPSVGQAQLIWTEGEPPVALSPNVSVSDPDSDAVSAMSITWTALDGLDERLVLPPTVPGTTVGEGRVDIAGPLTLANLRAGLAGVSFEVLGDDPSPGVRVLQVAAGGGVDTVAVEVVPVDDPARVDLGPANDAGTDHAVTLAAGAESVVIAHPESGVQDPDDDTFTGLTAVLSPRPDGLAETLAYAGPLAATWEDATGTLTLTGVADQASYEAALRALSYHHAGPAKTAGLRDVTVRVMAVGGPSDPATTTVTIDTERPELDLDAVTAGFDAMADWVEDAGPVFVLPQAVVSDGDSASLAGLRLTLGRQADPGEALASTASSTQSWNAATGTLELAGPLTPAAFQAALRGVTYDSAVQRGSGSVVVEVTAWDDGGDGTPRALTIDRSFVPDVPVVDLDTTSTDVPSAAWMLGGGPVSVLTAPTSITDVDSDAVAGVRLSVTPWVEGAETLTVVDPDGTTHTVVDGVLTVQTSGTLAAWAQALRSTVWTVRPSISDRRERTLAITALDAEAGESAPAWVTLTIVRTPGVDTGIPTSETDDSDDSDAVRETDDSDVPTPSDSDDPPKDDPAGCGDGGGCAAGGSPSGSSAWVGVMLLLAGRRRRRGVRPTPAPTAPANTRS